MLCSSDLLIPSARAIFQTHAVEQVDFLAGMKRLAFYILNPHLKDLKDDDA